MSETTSPNAPAPQAALAPAAPPENQADHTNDHTAEPTADQAGEQSARPQDPPSQRAGNKPARAPKPGHRNAGKGAARTPREVHPLLQRLWELHPRLFGARFRPLKLGIFEDLMARHPGEFAKDDLKQALGQHVRSSRYLEAVASGDLRHDLDGNPVEPVAIEHVQHAIFEIFRRRQARDAQAARTWAMARLIQALDASGLEREAYLESVRTHDPIALELIDAAFADLAAQAARREALVRAFRASGQEVDAFAEMYGLDAALVRDALARAGTA